jgi:hypothetical protein
MPIQPLSRVAHHDLDLMPSEPMKARPEVAVLVAECIAIWANIECTLGVTLAIILQTEAHTGLRMFSSLTSFSNQMAVLSAAAKAKLPPRDSPVGTSPG